MMTDADAKSLERVLRKYVLYLVAAFLLGGGGLVGANKFVPEQTGPAADRSEMIEVFKERNSKLDKIITEQAESGRERDKLLSAFGVRIERNEQDIHDLRRHP